MKISCSLTSVFSDFDYKYRKHWFPGGFSFTFSFYLFFFFRLKTEKSNGRGKISSSIRLGYPYFHMKFQTCHLNVMVEAPAFKIPAPWAMEGGILAWYQQQVCNTYSRKWLIPFFFHFAIFSPVRCGQLEGAQTRATKKMKGLWRVDLRGEIRRTKYV